MIEFSHVYKYYKKDWAALEDINFKIEKGEFVFLIGPSGAGKSTLLKLIYMEEKPTLGEVFVDDYSSATIKDKEIPFLRRKIGVIFQDFKLLDDRNVYENIAFGLEVTGGKRGLIKEKTLEILQKLHLGHRRNAFPYQLSGGERQRVAIGRALIREPFILLADEPTGNVDPETSKDIINLMKDINAEGTAILMATHDLSLVKGSGKRILNLEEGKLKGDI